MSGHELEQVRAKFEAWQRSLKGFRERWLDQYPATYREANPDCEMFTMSEVESEYQGFLAGYAANQRAEKERAVIDAALAYVASDENDGFETAMAYGHLESAAESLAKDRALNAEPSLPAD